MSNTELIAIVVFVAVAAFGIIDAIRTPIIVKRFYRDKKFTEPGRQLLEEVSDSGLLTDMYTDCFYTGSEQGLQVRQCKAWSTKRRQFTLSKKSRKRNQTAWSITVIDAKFLPVTFQALPTIVPEAIGYIGDGRSIEFPGDDKLSNRYHVSTDNAALVRAALVDELRDFLLQTEVVALEVTQDLIVLKRKWAAHLVLERLQNEIDFVVKLHNKLAGAHS